MRLEATEHASLIEPARDGGEDVALLCSSVDCNGGVIAVWSLSELSGQASCLVLTYKPLDEKFQHTVRVQGVIGFAPRQVQRFSSGNYVMSSGRTLSGKPIDQHNAVVVTSGGEVCRSAFIGDGITDFLVDAQDRLWVGYSEVAIYEGEALMQSGFSTPAEAGIAAFSEDLICIWRYRNPPGRVVEHTYFLNVAATTAFTLVASRRDPFNRFSVLVLSEFKESALLTLPAGTWAPRSLIASASVYVLLDAQSDSRRMLITRREGDDLIPLSWQETPVDFGNRVKLIARGSILYALIEQGWTRVQIVDECTSES